MIERVDLTVQGMTCDNCVASVTKALKGVDGVKVAKVTLQDERAQVTFDTQQTSIESLKAAVEASGYHLV